MSESITLSPEMFARTKAALDQYGEPVVRFAWDTLFVAFLPLAANILREQELLSYAKRCELTTEQVMDAMTLLEALQTSDSAHKAWVAAEILHRVTKNAANVLAAAQVPAQPQRN